MPGHNRWFEQQRYRPFPKHPLQYHHRKRHACQPGGLLKAMTKPPRQYHDPDDQQTQACCNIAVNHLAPGLAHRHRTVIAALFGHRLGDLILGLNRCELAVTTGPVRAAQASIGQSHPCADHDECETNQGAPTDQTPVCDKR